MADFSIRRRIARPAIAILVAASGWTGEASAADQPAGLILELTGEIEPALAPFTEIIEGTRLVLGDEARISFVHYETCKLVTMTGGEVRIDRRRYVISRGRVEAERSQDCPRQVQLTRNATGAGLLLRGGEDSAQIPLRPSFVLVGRNADEVRRVNLLEQGRMVASLPAEDRKLTWPDDLPDLVADTIYELALESEDGEEQVYEFLAVDSGRKKLLILRLD